MPPLHADTSRIVDRFVAHAVQSGLVWVLDECGRMAVCASHETSQFAAPVFSERAYAVQGARFWEDAFPVVSVSLARFTSIILPYHSSVGNRIGPDWDAQMAGFEICPDGLRDQLIAMGA